MNKKILLVNPWIYDFAAYDFWIKPLGLLQIGGMLKTAGYSVQLLDCLDRNHPALLNSGLNIPKTKPNGTGKYIREKVKKPYVLEHVTRNYCRYGLPVNVVKEQLQNNIEKPDLILLTSMMTYWYPAVKDIFLLLKNYFPDTPVVLGGVYATLVPDHAKRYIAPDYIFTGSDMNAILKLVNQITGVSNNLVDYKWFSAYDLYTTLDAVAVVALRGCPNRCSFCASHILYDGLDQRNYKDVFDEILYWYKHKNIKHVAFYDDALLYRSRQLIEPLLTEIVKSDIDIHLHTPNGIQPRFVDKMFSELFVEAGGHTIRLSFESVKPERQKSMSAKVNNDELIQAIDNLQSSGLDKNNIGVYVLMGLPDQDMDEVVSSVQFVKDLGVHVNIASFSPIPGTADWHTAINNGLWNYNNDLLLTNTSIYPLWSQKYGYDRVDTFMQFIKKNYINNPETGMIS